ncbi:MAG: hypothetical protein KF749_14940 [Bacteroidetes bacterium]|nr:hypothetical protein [Bacteroidota bacterium]MCW5896015.1 hypothetical protein [Bacteroidota bacterium]
MNTVTSQEQHTSLDLLAPQLAEIRTLIDQNLLTESLERVRTMKTVVPRNIFFAGLETQLVRLIDAEAAQASDASTIRASLGPLLDRSAESIHSGPKMRPRFVPQKPSGKTDREKAIESLKLQYFAHADTLMKKGDFDNALSEVRRVQLLDPSDSSAHQYIQKLEELYLLQLRTAQQPGNNRGTAVPADTIQQQSGEKKLAPPVISLDEMVTMMEPDFDDILAKSQAAQSSFASEHGTLNPPPQSEMIDGPVRRSKMSRFFIISATLIVSAIVASYFVVSGRAHDGAESSNASISLPAHNTAVSRAKEGASATPSPGQQQTLSSETHNDSLQILTEQNP